MTKVYFVYKSEKCCIDGKSRHLVMDMVMYGKLVAEALLCE